MITLKELAKELKVSVSTVSKALHDSPEISVQTIEKVKKLAKKRNYKPNKIALSLKSNRIGANENRSCAHFFLQLLKPY